MAAGSKLLSRDQLMQSRAAARVAGKTVVHCHGCFDIVHPGHIHHLQSARSLGDHLIVSVSADPHVNKGVSRPLIPDDLRASALAALECVDAVYLNGDPTALELIDALQPDIYVKGREYEQNNDPRFLAERDAVVRNGGRVVFSSGDIVYSSTALIGSYQLAQSMDDEKIARFRARHGLDSASLQNLVQRFRDQRMIVIGDAILDRYHFCEAGGVAGEAPMMALRTLEQNDYDGGASIIAAHLAAMGARPTLLVSSAEDAIANASEARLANRGIDVRSLRIRRQSVVKHRFLVDSTKLFKVDEGTVAPLDSQNESLLAEQIFSCVCEGDIAAVIFADFGYGTISTGLLDRVMPIIRKQVPVITADVSGRQSSLLSFTDVDLLCPTEREVRETIHDFSSGLGSIVSHLLQRTRAKQALITLGKQGLVACNWPENSAAESNFRLSSEYLPALPARAIDPLGCGDALLAIASLTLAVGGSLPAAALLGSAAAAIEVASLGNIPVAANELLDAVANQTAVPISRAA